MKARTGERAATWTIGPTASHQRKRAGETRRMHRSGGRGPPRRRARGGRTVCARAGESENCSGAHGEQTRPRPWDAPPVARTSRRTIGEAQRAAPRRGRRRRTRRCGRDEGRQRVRARGRPKGSRAPRRNDALRHDARARARRPNAVAFCAGSWWWCWNISRRSCTGGVLGRGGGDSSRQRPLERPESL